MRHFLRQTLILTCAFDASTLRLSAQLAPSVKADVDSAVRRVLAESGLPSAEVGIVQNGAIVYTAAFGQARLQPSQPARPEMAYPIGSISKQFTTTAVLLLQEQGKLSLNDPVAKYFPELTQARDVTLRNLLTHTSGYQDYAPQDYTIPAWRLPGDPLAVVREFGSKPLDFQPGTQWQYSNTNFVIAALIVQKVSGEPFAQFLRERVIRPVGLEHVLNLNTDQSKLQVTGYMRNALGPLRPAQLEAPGWYFGDGDLAMPVASLLTWDIALLQQSLLSHASYQAMAAPFVLKDGKDSHYGLGVDLRVRHGRRTIEHSGEVGGFVAENIVFPDQHAAIAVLTNQEASGAAGDIAQAIESVLFAQGAAASSADPLAATLQAILSGLQHGSLDRSLFTPDCNAYFDAEALEDFRTSLGPLGEITGTVRTHSSLRGGMSFGVWRVSFSGGTTLVVTTYVQPDGRLEQLLVQGKG